MDSSCRLRVVTSIAPNGGGRDGAAPARLRHVSTDDRGQGPDTQLRHLYPIDWPRLSALIRFGHARGRYMRCKRPHHPGNNCEFSHLRRISSLS
jgi:hypothetical protein